MCSRKRRIHSQTVSWQFLSSYNTRIAPTLRYKEINVRTTEQLGIERELFTQGDPKWVSIIIKNDYRQERKLCYLIGWEYIFLIFSSYKIYLFFNWRIIALWNFVDFCQTSTWIRHRYTYVLPSGTSFPQCNLFK